MGEDQRSENQTSSKSPSEASLESLFSMDLTWAEQILLAKYSKHRRRPPHPPLAMLKALIYQRLRQIPSWRQLAQTIRSDKNLALRLGFQRPPSHYSFSDFTKKVGEEAFNEIFYALVDRLRMLMPDLGKIVAVDSTQVDAYSKLPREGFRGTDPDAAFGFTRKVLRKRFWTYGYKLHVTCDARHDIPLSFEISPANRSDMTSLYDQLKLLAAYGNRPRVLTADAGYDSKMNIFRCIKYGIKPVIALNPRRSKNKQGRAADNLLPIKRGSAKWNEYYSMRSAIERVFARLKEELGLKDLKLRTISRVSVHFALCLITMLMITLASFSIGRSELYRSLGPWRY